MIKEENITFALNVETIVKEKKMSYIDAILYYCNLHDIELELVPNIIPGALQSKVQREAEELHFLPRPTTNKLPI
jgi:hypothetical protein